MIVAWHLCFRSSKQSIELNVEVVSISVDEGIIVTFWDGDRMSYRWAFDGVLYAGKKNIDLNVDYDGKTLKYNFGDKLPHPAYFQLYVGLPEGTVVNLKDESGKIIYSPVVDDEGIITLNEFRSCGEYRLFKDTIKIGAADKVEQIMKKELKDVPVLSNIGVLIVILVLVVAGTVFGTIAITKHFSVI